MNNPYVNAPRRTSAQAAALAATAASGAQRQLQPPPPHAQAGSAQQPPPPQSHHTHSHPQPHPQSNTQSNPQPHHSNYRYHPQHPSQHSSSQQSQHPHPPPPSHSPSQPQSQSHSAWQSPTNYTHPLYGYDPRNPYDGPGRDPRSAPGGSSNPNTSAGASSNVGVSVNNVAGSSSSAGTTVGENRSPISRYSGFVTPYVQAAMGGLPSASDTIGYMGLPSQPSPVGWRAPGDGASMGPVIGSGDTSSGAMTGPSRGVVTSSPRREEMMVNGRGQGLSNTPSDGDPSRPSTSERDGAGVGIPAGMAGLGASGGSSSVAPGYNVGPKQEIDEDEDDKDDNTLDHRKRKRNRTIRSCVPCHNHKRKCDRKRPCGRCTALGLTGSCVYEVDEVRDTNDPEVIESDRLRRRIAELETVVRELRQRTPKGLTGTGPTPTSGAGPPSLGTGAEELSDNKKRRVIVDRFARFKMGEMANNMSHDEPTILPGGGGLLLGDDASPTASSGSGRRDHYAEPYQSHSLPGEELVIDHAGRKTFLGGPAGKSMLRRLREITSDTGEELLNVPEDAAFTGWFPSSRKTFPFTTIWSHESFVQEIVGLLPSTEQSETLLQCFNDEVAAFFQAWHLPTLKADFRRFFALPNSAKVQQPMANLAVYLMICSLGSMMRASISEIFGHPDRDVAMAAKASGIKPRDPKDLTSSRRQSELYLSAAFQALRLCSFLSTPNIQTIQAQVLINIYLLNSERAADSWSLMGSLVRQCVAMGLHVDPLSLDKMYSLRDAEVRRRIWWTVAGLDCLLCVSFGRPSVITFWTTSMPLDMVEDDLSEAPGTAIDFLPKAGESLLSDKTTEQSYHAAYYQITVPSLELLERVFHINWKAARTASYSWFNHYDDDGAGATGAGGGGGGSGGQSASGGAGTNYNNMGQGSDNTYEDAIRLGRDIFEWYAHVPRGMRFEPDEDNAEEWLRTADRTLINQRLALCVKTFMLVLILHRPYLRADPSAYPESSDICLRAAHTILSAYKVMSLTKSSIQWSWWTMTYRAFHAGTVCAFLAIRQPGTDLAAKCLDDLRGAITIFEDRISTWNAAHPVQADLCDGLVKLEHLASAATQQRQSRSTHPSGSGMTHRLRPDGTLTASSSPELLRRNQGGGGGGGGPNPNPGSGAGPTSAHSSAARGGISGSGVGGGGGAGLTDQLSYYSAPLVADQGFGLPSQPGLSFQTQFTDALGTGGPGMGIGFNAAAGPGMLGVSPPQYHLGNPIGMIPGISAGGIQGGSSSGHGTGNRQGAAGGRDMAGMNGQEREPPWPQIDRNMGFMGDGYSRESQLLPQIWATMFNIKLDQESGLASALQ